LLGHDQRLRHRVSDGGQLVIDLPKKQSGSHAHALKLTGFEISLSDEPWPAEAIRFMFRPRR
jgi:hypothetical protein